MAATAGSRLCAPYQALSRAYDATLGKRFFARARRAYCRLARRYGVEPRVAADLGSGTGLFAAWLSRSKGIRVYAVDRSAAMLRSGASNLQGTDVVPLRQDIRYLELPEPVDLATAHYDTINHLTHPRDVLAAFAAVARAVRPGGFFVFDFITPNQRLASPLFRMRCGASLQVLQRVRYLPRKRLLRVVVAVQRRRFARRLVERHYERAYAPAEIVAWLTDAGFRVRGLHDAFTLRSVRYRCPPRIVVVAQRR
jgi:SAM-dependent methyltransferase